MRRTRTVLIALVVAAGALLAGCGIRPASAPSGTSCAGTSVDGTIRSAFAGTGQEAKALHIAWRESRCNPGARNRSGAVGLFQLLNHPDLFWAVCPFDYQAPVKAHCNAKAARLLYNSSGWAPWGG
jgi:soluble lytic murein transglycosylase-like protein